MKYRSRSYKPYKNASPIAPQEGDILGRSFIAILQKDPLTSNLDYLRQHLFPKFGVSTRNIGEVLVAAIIDPYLDDHALNKVKTETERWCSEVSVRQYIPFTNPEDRIALCERAMADKMLTTGEKVRYHPRNDYPKGGLYIILDEEEKECLYVGQTRSDPATRADQHFHRDNDMKTPFDIYCRDYHPQSASWKVYLIDPLWCDHIARKSMFWDQEEYIVHMPPIKDKYCQRAMTDPVWFLNKAENALIELFKPRFNVSRNVRILVGIEASSTS